MNNICLLDGSAGTALWAMAEEAGVKKEPVWKYSIEHPEFVTRLHQSYIEAGSQLIQTNTFAVNRKAVKDSSDYSVKQVVSASVRLAKEATAGTGVGYYVTFGPLSQLLTPYGNLTREETEETYTELVSAAAEEGGAKFIVFETFFDVEMMKIAVNSARKFDLPVICSMTFAKRRKTMMGNSVQNIIDALTPLGIDGIGMNCSFGPVEALPILQEFAEKTDLPLYYKPNSGVGEQYSAEQFAQEVRPALPYVSYVGGCCGCDRDYIKELARVISSES